MPEFTCDFKSQSVTLEHFWERCVGSGHSALALRADYQAQLKRCVRDLGFQRVRFHGWFLDEMGLVRRQGNQIVYSFLNADRIIDFYNSIGISPFVDHRLWQAAVKSLMKYWRDSYGMAKMRDWYFEVWNEPNWPPFWTGNQADYFKFYQFTAEAVKAVDANLQVGGPATAQNKWIPEFTRFCHRNKTPLDFVSTHHYPNDPPLDKAAPDTRGQLAAGRRSQLRDETRDVKSAVTGPLFYTEWNTSSDDRDPLHDEPYAAAFIIKTILEANGLVDLYSFWVFTDVFAEQNFESLPFHGGFGLMNVHGIPKPSYRAFELLHGLGNELLVSDGLHSTVDAWFVRGKNFLTVMLTNYALPAHEIKNERVRIKIRQTRRPTSVSVRRIDREHANPRQAWVEMGSPEYLTSKQIDQLEDASALEREKVTFRHANETTEFDLLLPAYGVAAVLIEFRNAAN
jgi:xylan 1,4-beta-xylosidase